MRRLIAALATSFLVFFGVMFGVRFWEAGTSPFRGQVSQPQVQYLPDSFGSELRDIYPGPDGNIWVMSDDMSRISDLGIDQKILRVKPDGTMASSFPLDAQAFEFRGQIFGGRLWLMSFVFDYLDDGVHQEQRNYLVSVAPDGSVASHRSYRTRSKMGPDGFITQTYIDGVETSRNVDYINWIWEYFPGPDGFLWAESEGNWYKVSPSGEFTPFTITPPSLPGITPAAPNRLGGPGMSKGGDGNMWYFFEGYGAAGRSLYFVSITPQGISTPYPIADLYGASDGTCGAGSSPYSGYPSRLTVGSDGNMWYSYAKASCAEGSVTYEGRIGKILHDGTMQTYALPAKVFAQGDGSYYYQGVAMVAGPDGNVWFMYADGSGASPTYGIGNITPGGAVTLVPTPGSIPSRIASGADGNIWFVTKPDYKDSGTNYSAVKIGKVAVTSAWTFPSSSGNSSSRAPAASSVFSSQATAQASSSKSSVSSTDRCGNKIRNSEETCDDGDKDSGDGCSSSCQLERGYECSGIYCIQICGDGFVTKDEQCDDNNRRSGDGCSAACLVEAQRSTTSLSAVSTAGPCGVSGSTCEDGNTQSGDGCSASCVIEDGYTCYAGACITLCGDGKKRGQEQCDDGNRYIGDGCSNYCRMETGYSCIGTTCYAVCGDGIALGSEECDDKDLSGGDGCSANCRIEDDWICGGRPSQCYFQGAAASSVPVASSRASFAAASSASSSSVSSVSVSSAASASSFSSVSSMDRVGPYFVPDWLFPRTSSRSSASSSFDSSVSSDAASSSSELSVESSSVSSEESSVSSESSSSSASSLSPCGNGIQDEGEECDAGSLNGSPVTQCSATCEFLSPAAGSSSASAEGEVASATTRTNPFLIMILVALAVIVVGGIASYIWLKIQDTNK